MTRSGIRASISLSGLRLLALAALAVLAASPEASAGPIVNTFFEVDGEVEGTYDNPLKKSGGAGEFFCDPEIDPDCVTIMKVLPGLAGIIPPGTPLRLQLLFQTTSPASLLGEIIGQPIDTFSFQLSLPSSVPGLAGAVVLAGVGTADNSLVGILGGTTATLRASTLLGDTVIFTSDFLNFDATQHREVEFTFSNISPTLAIDSDGIVRSFTAQLTRGVFRAGPEPQVVPEPASLLLAGLGIGILGCTVGRRRTR